jgi:ATP-binding cassette subfamily F protein 3
MVSHDFYTIANCVDYILFVEDKSVRKMRTRSFRKMIYENHFSKDYLASGLFGPVKLQY